MKTKSILLRQAKIDPSRHRTISIVGAGGKTSLLKRLRDELVSQGLKVLLTTSTHILYEEDMPFAEGGDAGQIQRLIREYGYAVTGIAEDHPASGKRKIASLEPGALRCLANLCDVMLIEADGARGMEVKVPAEWEPVIYPWTDMVISVAGAGAIGKRIKDAAYMPDGFAAFLGKSPEDIVSCGDIVRIASSDRALRKGSSGMDYRFCLNAVDAAVTSAEDIVKTLHELKTDHGIEAFCASMRHAGDTGVVIMAAGLGTRFGSDKLGITVNGRPMYMHVLEETAGVFGYENITFVTSHEGIGRELSRTGAQVIINERPQDGQSVSMKLGLLANLHKGSCMFAVADQPLISRSSISSLFEGYMDSDRGMASLVDGRGDFSNPCIFSSCYYEELLAVSGDRGGKSVIKKHSDDVYTCSPMSEDELRDVDTPEDLEEIYGRNRRRAGSCIG